MEITLAIVGSRLLSDAELFDNGIRKAIEIWGEPHEVVSGGARGADTMAAQWARHNGIKIREFRPDWQKHGKAAGIIRNKNIIGAATHVLAFPSKSGKGTQNSIKLAKDRGKPLIVYWID